MLRKIPAALAIAALGSTLLVAGPASAACGNNTGRTNLAADTPTVDTVGVGNMVDKYTLVVPAGKRGFLALQMLNGDIDIEVCRDSNNSTVCESHNIAGVHDGCHVSEASVALPSPPWNPGTYLAQWGDALSPGTYRLDVKNCFHSSQGTGCDYLDSLAGVTLVPGAHDAAPPVAYGVLFSVQ